MQLVCVPTLDQSQIGCWLTPFSSCAWNSFLFPDWLLPHAASGGFKGVVGGARQCIKTKPLPPFALEYSGYMCGAEGAIRGPLFAYPCLTASFSLSPSSRKRVQDYKKKRIRFLRSVLQIWSLRGRDRVTVFHQNLSANLSAARSSL